MATYSESRKNGYNDDYDDVVLYDRDDDYGIGKLFGCACEDPSSVDTVCEGCIEWLQDQERRPAPDREGSDGR